jgi:hypothetical protein
VFQGLWLFQVPNTHQNSLFSISSVTFSIVDLNDIIMPDSPAAVQDSYSARRTLRETADDEESGHVEPSVVMGSSVSSDTDHDHTKRGSAGVSSSYASVSEMAPSASRQLSSLARAVSPVVVVDALTTRSEMDFPHRSEPSRYAVSAGTTNTNYVTQSRPSTDGPEHRIAVETTDLATRRTLADDTPTYRLPNLMYTSIEPVPVQRTHNSSASVKVADREADHSENSRLQGQSNHPQAVSYPPPQQMPQNFMPSDVPSAPALPQLHQQYANYTQSHSLPMPPQSHQQFPFVAMSMQSPYPGYTGPQPSMGGYLPGQPNLYGSLQGFPPAPYGYPTALPQVPPPYAYPAYSAYPTGGPFGLCNPYWPMNIPGGPLPGTSVSASQLVAQSLTGLPSSAGVSGSDPLVHDLLKELRQAKEDAAWAKNKLSEIILLMHDKSGQAEQTRDILKATQVRKQGKERTDVRNFNDDTNSGPLRHSRRKGGGDDACVTKSYSSDEFEEDEYSNDFDNTDILPATELNGQSSHRTSTMSKAHGVGAPVHSTHDQPVFDSKSIFRVRDTYSKDLVSAMPPSVAVSAGGNADITSSLLTSQALFRRQLQSLRDRLNMTTAGANLSSSFLQHSRWDNDSDKFGQDRNGQNGVVPLPAGGSTDLGRMPEKGKLKLWEIILQTQPHLDELSAKELAQRYSIAM